MFWILLNVKITRTSVLEKASKAVWELILNSNGIGMEISETVEQVFCRLSGRELPLFVSDFGSQSEKGKEKQNGQEREKEEFQVTEKENSESASKKRKLDESNTIEVVDEAGSKSSDKITSSDDSTKMPPPSARGQSTS